MSGVLALALAATGCGDSGDESSATSTAAEGTQSKAEFIAAADQVCSSTADAVNVEVEKRFSNANKAPSNEELLAFFSEVTLPALQTQFDEIDALPPPAGEEQAVQEFVDSGNAAISESEGDPSLLLVPQGAPTPFDDVSQLAQDFGLKVCGAADPDAGS